MTPFRSHHWGNDEESRDNHKRVKAISDGLRDRGIKVWLDENIMDEDLTNQMSDGIDNSRLVAVFITRLYIQKVQGLGPRGLDDNCKGEFDYSLRRRGTANILPVVMESSCLNPDEWTGAVGFRLGSKLYTNLSEGLVPPDNQLDDFAETIRKRLGNAGRSKKKRASHHSLPGL